MDANRNVIKKRKNAFSVLFQKDPKQRRLKKRKSTSGKGKLQIDAECPVCFGLFDSKNNLPERSQKNDTDTNLLTAEICINTRFHMKSIRGRDMVAAHG